MGYKLTLEEEENLRQKIVSECVWSETFTSLKQILSRTANQLPLLVSFGNNSLGEQYPENVPRQTIFFIDRNISNKLLFTPLNPIENKSDEYEVYPKHCTFAITDSFKGIIEFLRDGQRQSRIFTTVRELVDFAIEKKFEIIFMGRNVIEVQCLDKKTKTWSNKTYSPGSIFQAQDFFELVETITTGNVKTVLEYIECLDEEGHLIYLPTEKPGRYSLIATSIEQDLNNPETFLYSTQTTNISDLIKRLTPSNAVNSNCIRLVRGPVPACFFCQHFMFIRQQSHDILMGTTSEGLVIEWNLDSRGSCCYATNLNEILRKFSRTYLEEKFEIYIDQLRRHYRGKFLMNLQLMSMKNWGSIFEFWKWTQRIPQAELREMNTSNQSRHRFNIAASVQDLVDHAPKLYAAVKHLRVIDSARKSSNTAQVRVDTAEDRETSQEPKATPSRSTVRTLQNSHRQRPLSHTRASTSFLALIKNPFDNTAYDSNQASSKFTSVPVFKPAVQRNARRTQ